MKERKQARQYEMLRRKIQDDWWDEQMRLIMEDLKREHQANKDKNK